MGTMPDPIEKDSILKKLDLFTEFNAGNTKEIEKLINKLDSKKLSVSIKALSRAIGLDPLEHLHFKQWLANDEKWKVADTGETTGAALQELLCIKVREALVTVKTVKKGLDCFWVCFPDQDRVEIHRTRNADPKLAFDIHTPPPREP